MTNNLRFIFILSFILLIISNIKPGDSFASDDTSNKITKPQIDNNLRNYLISVGSHIHNSWELPNNFEWDKNLLVFAIIKFDKNGQIIKTDLKEKSKNEYFNNLVLQTIKKSNPLPPFPHGINREEMEIGVKFMPPASDQDISTEKKAEIEKLLNN